MRDKEETGRNKKKDSGRKEGYRFTEWSVQYYV